MTPGLFGKSKKVPASPDSLVRRLFLDLLNRTPEYDEFMEARVLIDEDKYTTLVDKLLAKREFTENLAHKVVDHYAAAAAAKNANTIVQLKEHISIKYLTPKADFRTFLKDFITARGGERTNPLIRMYHRDEDTADLAGRMAQRILALPLTCARCHDHKDYKKIKQKDYWAFTAFFNKMERNRVEKQDDLRRLYKSMGDKTAGMTKFGREQYDLLKTWMQGEDQKLFTGSKKDRERMMNPTEMKMKQLMDQRLKKPQYVIGESPVKLGNVNIYYEYQGKRYKTLPSLPFKRTSLRAEEKPREFLADWIVRADNPYTSKAIVNWVANWLYGRGYIMPVYDIYGGVGEKKADLEKIARNFRNNKFNMTKLVREIVLSKSYRLKTSYKTDELAFANFSARRFRYLSSDQLLNSLYRDKMKEWQNIGSRGKKALLGFERQKLSTAARYFPRSLEDTTANFKGTMPQALYMTINQRFTSFVDREANWAYRNRAKTTKEKFLIRFFIKIYTRTPTKSELAFFTKKLNDDAAYDKSGYYEVIWTLVNSPEMRIY